MDGALDPDLYVGEVTGYRNFIASLAGGLQGTFTKWRWPRDGAVARCRPDLIEHGRGSVPEQHLAPYGPCGCGLHVLRDVPLDSLAPHFIAVVAASGTIVPHRDGFRAERARVLALYDPLHRGSLLEALAVEYGAESCQHLAELATFATSPLPEYAYDPPT